MFRAQPVASRVCDDKFRDRSYRIHRQKLQKIKPSIDNKAPPMYPHLYQKLKKAQMEEERCSEIERDNRTLVRRMTEIMQRSGIDTKNSVQYRSLNKDMRRRELVRITQENQALLKRIQSRQPTYNHLLWEQDREKSEALCERICRYPYRPGDAEYADEYYEDEYYGGDAHVQQPDPYISHQPREPAAAAPEAAQSQSLGMSQSAQSAASDASPKSQSCVDDASEGQPDGASKSSVSHHASDDLDASASGKSSKSGRSGAPDDSDEDED